MPLLEELEEEGSSSGSGSDEEVRQDKHNI
jgi:hypothetical protein